MALASLMLCLSLKVFSQISPTPTIDEDILREVERAVVVYPTDVAASPLSQTEREFWEKARATRERERLQRIQNQVGLAPYLVALADGYLAREETEGLHSIMQAIALRRDIPPQDLSRFVQMTRDLLCQPNVLEKAVHGDFLAGMAAVIAAHPPLDGEGILIQMLQYRDDYTGVPLKLAAAKELAQTGTRRALPAMEQSSKWLQQFALAADPLRLKQATQMDEQVKAMRSRLFEVATLPASPSTSIGSPDPSISNTTASLSDSPDPKTEGLEWLGGALVGSAAIGLLILFFRKRR